MLGLQGTKLRIKCVVFAIGDRRIVEYVVAVVVRFYGAHELVMSNLRTNVRHGQPELTGSEPAAPSAPRKIPSPTSEPAASVSSFLIRPVQSAEPSALPPPKAS